MFTKILVAVDGSAPSGRALSLGCALAEQFGASLHLVHAAEVEPAIMAAHPGVAAVPVNDRSLLEAGEATLAEAKTAAAGEGATLASANLKQGPASQIILSEINTIGADLVVMGRQGRSGLERFFLGSVSRQVANEADCACLTVK